MFFLKFWHAKDAVHGFQPAYLVVRGALDIYPPTCPTVDKSLTLLDSYKQKGLI